MDFPHQLRVLATRHLAEPVINTGEQPHGSANRHHVVEVSNDVVCVVQRAVYTSLRQNDAGYAAQSEQEDKSDSEKHWRVEAN